MSIFKVSYSYEDTQFMLVQADTADEAAERLEKQLKSQGLKYEIKSISLMQEVPTKTEGYIN